MKFEFDYEKGLLFIKDENGNYLDSADLTKNISYDYSDLICEIEEDIEEELLSLDEDIQILRGDSIKIGDFEFRPIIDYYQNDSIMNKMFENEFETFDKEFFGESEELSEIQKQYQSDKEKLVTIKVESLLKELRYFDRII